MTRVCFVHVPKCGGVSFNTAIRKVIKIGRYSRRNFTLNAKKTQIYATRNHLDVMDYRESLLVKALENPRIRFAGGHFRCSEGTRQKFQTEWKFVTILRDPVKRWISQYYYNRFKKSDHAKVDLTLDEYLKSDIGKGAGADYVKYLSGKTFSGKQSEIDSTIENLDQFAAVTILENQEDLLLQFENILGKPFPLTRKNKNPAGQDVIDREITASHRERIKEICAADIQIYDHFSERKIS